MEFTFIPRYLSAFNPQIKNVTIITPKVSFATNNRNWFNNNRPVESEIWFGVKGTWIRWSLVAVYITALLCIWVWESKSRVFWFGWGWVGGGGAHERNRILLCFLYYTKVIIIMFFFGFIKCYVCNMRAGRLGVKMRRGEWGRRVWAAD